MIIAIRALEAITFYKYVHYKELVHLNYFVDITRV